MFIKYLNIRSNSRQGRMYFLYLKKIYLGLSVTAGVYDCKKRNARRRSSFPAPCSNIPIPGNRRAELSNACFILAGVILKYLLLLHISRIQ